MAKASAPVAWHVAGRTGSRLGMGVRLQPGEAVLDRIEAAGHFVLRPVGAAGELVADGEDYGAGSAFEIAPGEDPVAFTATQDAELVCMVLHRF